MSVFGDDLEEVDGGFMSDKLTTVWSELIDIASKPWLKRIKTFIFRYALQATLYSIWWERNARRHGEKPRDENSLIKLVDKCIRLKLLSLKGRGDYYEEGLITWFGVYPNIGS